MVGEYRYAWDTISWPHKPRYVRWCICANVDIADAGGFHGPDRLSGCNVKVSSSMYGISTCTSATAADSAQIKVLTAPVDIHRSSICYLSNGLIVGPATMLPPIEYPLSHRVHCQVLFVVYRRSTTSMSQKPSYHICVLDRFLGTSSCCVSSEWLICFPGCWERKATGLPDWPAGRVGLRAYGICGAETIF